MAIPPNTHPGQPDAPGGDPSMEDILASIRRILNEDEAVPAAAHAAEPEPEPEDDVLMLDESMLVEEPPAAVTAAAPSAASQHPMPEPHAPELQQPEQRTPQPHMSQPDPYPPEPNIPGSFAAQPAAPELLAPATAAAAASSVGSLLRTLSAERSVRTNRDGPTIEDLVREEIRPFLKDWLDSHLPPLVERLVRAEIERVMGRAAP